MTRLCLVELGEHVGNLSIRALSPSDDGILFGINIDRHVRCHARLCSRGTHRLEELGVFAAAELGLALVLVALRGRDGSRE